MKAVAIVLSLLAQQPQEFNQRIAEVLEQAYRKPEIVAFCRANSEAVYLIEIDGLTVNVRCSAWWVWARKHGIAG